MHNRKILIIGEVYVDQHLDIIENGYSTSRLGGIFHAARSCDALNIEYALAYYAPDYLVKDVEKFGIDVLRASSIFQHVTIYAGIRRFRSDRYNYLSGKVWECRNFK